MISLFLDSASYFVVVGIYQGTEPLYLKIEQNDNHLSERLLPMVKEAFDSISMKLSSLHRIYVVNGPGSFTGVRIGVTVAKTIAWALKKEIIPISELELMASTETDSSIKIPMIDARRSYVFAGIYDADLNSVMKDSYISIDELLSKKDDNTVLISADTFSFDTKIPEFNISEIIEKHQNDQPINPHELKPNYLKRTEAEEKYDSQSRES